MQRRSFLKNAAVVPMAMSLGWIGAARAGSVPSEAGWRRYEMTTDVELPASEGPATLWLPVAQSAGGYQKSLGIDWNTSAPQASLMHDPVYNAGLLRLGWTTQPTRQVRLVQTVAVRDRGAEGVRAGLAEQQLYLQPTPDMPLDGIVRTTSERIVAGCVTPLEKVRAIYDWVVDNTFRDPNTPGCGMGHIRQMLETRSLGGKCADMSSLMVGLTRAAGIPAREVYGIRVDRSAQFPSLGASGDISKAQHCRAEVHLADRGWMPVDPADVRKVVLQDRLPLADPRVAALRERAFGNWEMNWVGYNTARDFSLPGSTQIAEFAMYPCSSTKAGQRDCLQPKQFRYAISARRV